MFDLDADLGAVHAVLADDPLLARAIAAAPGLRVPCAWEGFELAVRAVLGQQISVAGATTLARRLVERWGARRADASPRWPGLTGRSRHLPRWWTRRWTPSACRAPAPPPCALAAAVVEGRLSFAAGQRLEDVVAAATALPGIGPWTAHYIAMRALALPDAFPAGDLVVQQRLGADAGIARLTERATEARSRAWRPWRAYAVLHLWHLPADPVPAHPVPADPGIEAHTT